MQRLHMLNQYEEATLVGARIASSKMGFFYDDINDPNPEEYQGSELDDEEEIIELIVKLNNGEDISGE